MRLALLIALAAAARAAYYDGLWMTKKTPVSGPSTGHYAATTSGNDFMWVAGGDANSNGTYQYSWSNNTWTNLGPLPWWSTNLTATDLAWAGGNLFLFGGAVAGVPSNILWVKSTAGGSGWQMVPHPSSAPPPRSGHRLPIINGYLLLIGGWNGLGYYGGVWAYDLTQLTRPTIGWSNTQWTNIVPDSSMGGVTSPRACSGASSVIYEDRVVVFGGFWHNSATPITNPTDCITNPLLGCTFYNEVWIWVPPVPISNTPWTKVAPRNGITPGGRAFHSSGLVNGETMVIYGGWSGNGPLNDLWSFDISYQTWRQLVPMGAAPGNFFAVGNSIGRHFVLYDHHVPNNMYVYYPPDANFIPEPAPEEVECDGTHLAGVNAGIVITILILIATTTFTAWTWKILRGGGAAAKDMYAAM